MEIRIDASKSAVFVVSGALTLLVVYLLYDKFVVSVRHLNYDSMVRSLESISEKVINESKKSREVKEIQPIRKITVNQSKTDQPTDFPKIKERVKRKYIKRKKK